MVVGCPIPGIWGAGVAERRVGRKGISVVMCMVVVLKRGFVKRRLG